MDRRRLVSCIVACAFVSGFGCSSSYMPRPGPRVAMIQQSGNPCLRARWKGLRGRHLRRRNRRSGPRQSRGRIAREGLQEPNDRRISRNGGRSNRWSLVSLVSAGALSRTDNGGSNTEATTGGVLLAGGLGAYITGFVLILTAQPHMWDAINVYNDGVPMGRCPMAIPPPPGYYYPPPPPDPWKPSSPGPAPAPASSVPARAR